MLDTETDTTQRQPGACVHHWVLSLPERGSVKDTCRRCGAHRAFPAGLQVPAPAPEGEEEPALDLPALAAAVSSLEHHALM